MAKMWPVGKWIAAPAEHRQDKETGVVFDVLTGGVGNNTHVYFNRANFTCDGKCVIFRSDRTGSWQASALSSVAATTRDATTSA